MLLIASDHGGFELKEQLKQFLSELGIEVEDLGCKQGERVDYPDYALALARKVANGEAEAGILICGTGIGMSIAANKVKGIRAALVHDEYTARMSKMHNNANVICFGGRTTGPEVAKAALKVWLDTKFEGGRHIRRLEKIAEAER